MTEEETQTPQDAPQESPQQGNSTSDFWEKASQPIQRNDPKEFWGRVESVEAKTNPQINYAIAHGADIDGERAKRILNIQKRLTPNTPVPFIDRNLEYLEKKTEEKDFKSDLFFNQDEKLKSWVTQNAPTTALLRSNPEEMQKLGLMKLLLERHPALWPLSESTIDADAKRISKLRAERDWKNFGATDTTLNLARISAAASGGQVGPTAFPTAYASQKAMEDSYYQQELDKRHHIEGIIRGTDQIGPMEAMILRHPDNPVLKNITGLIPIAAHAPVIAEKAELQDANKAMQANTADPIQQDLVMNAARLEAVANLRGKSLGAHFAETLASFPAMAGEMAMGGGLGSAAVKGFGGKLLGGALESAVGAGTAGLPNAIEAYQAMDTPKASLGEDEKGNTIIKYRDEKGEDKAWLLPKAALSSFADYYSAKLLGPWFSKASPAEQLLAKKSLLMAFPMEGLKMQGMNDVASFMKGLGGVQPLEVPKIVRAFSDPEVMKEVIANIGTGGFAGVMHAAQHNARVNTFTSQLGAEGIKALGDLAKDCKVMTETPDTGRDFISKMADGGNEHVYAPIEKWDQYWTSKGVSPREAARAVLGDTTAYDEALRLKGHLQIPIADYVQKLGLQEHGEPLSKDFKLRPEEPSHNEAQEQVKATESGQPLMPEEYLRAAGKPYSDLWMLGMKGEKAEKMQAALDAAMGSSLDKLKEEEIAKRTSARNKELDEVREQVRPQVEEMVGARKEWKALERLKGSEPELKLSSDEVDSDHYPKGISHKDGLSADSVAESLGFNSGDELLQSLRDLKDVKKADVVKDQTDTLIHEMRPDLFQPPQLSAADLENMKAENHSRLLKMQWEHLLSEDYAKAVGLVKAVERRPRSLESYRTQAVTEIGAKTVRDTNPMQYKADMEAARKEAENAIFKGDVETAADAKERELDAYEHYRAALEAQQRNRAMVNWARGTQSQDFRAKLGKADADYLAQYDALAARFELARVPQSVLESRQILRDFVAEKQAGESGGEDLMVPEWILNEANKVNYKDLTNDQLRDVVDTVKQLDTLATNKNKLIAGEKAVEWKESEGKLSDEVRQNKPTDLEPTRSAMTWVDKLKKIGRKIDASLIKTEQFLKEMTGGDITSEWFKRFWHPLADAQAKEYDYTEKVTSKIAQAIQEMPPEIRSKMRQVVQFDGARRMTRVDLIGLALNAGNDSNLSKLVRGEAQRKGGLSEAQIHEALNMLSAPEIDYVNKIHRILEGIYPDINALHQELTGLPLERVLPKSMTLANGTIDGGYYPIIYDASSSTQGAKQQEARVGDVMTDGYSRATLGWGHRKGRVEGFAAPIDFDIDNLPNHMASVIKDITHRRWMIDANKIMQSKEIRAALTDTYGEDITNRLTEIVKEAVNDRNQPSLASTSVWRKLVTGFRTNTAIVATGFKLATLMEHTFSIGAAVDELGADYFQKGLGKTLQAPKDALREASEMSGEIRHFLENGSRDIRDKLRELEGRSDSVAGIQRTAAHAIGFANMARALPVWWGAYYKALEALPTSKGLEGAELQKYAVYSADQALRLTVGTAGAKDLSAVQSGARGGEMMKLFTMFYTPGSVLYSRLHDVGHEWATEKNLPGTLMRLGFILPFSATMQALCRGEFPRKDKDETWGGWWLKNNATYPFSSVPILRDMANTVAYGRESSIDTPGTAAVRNILDAAEFSKKAWEGEATARDAIRKAHDAANTYFGLPDQQLWSIGDYLKDLHDGEAQSNNVFELYRNLLHYRHKPQK